MARRKKGLQLNLKAFRPSRFFVQKGRVLWARVFTFLGVLLALAIWQSDLSKRQEVAMAPAQEQAFTDLSREQFIARIAPEAQTLQTQYGVLASISIAQAALESNWGQSQLAAKYNNFFGVKAVGNTPSVTLETQEYVDGQWVTIHAAFRHYATWQESMVDHAQLLAHGTTDNPQRYQAVITAQNYQNAAHALVSGGYATDPSYATKIIEMIETYELNQYDKK